MSTPRYSVWSILPPEVKGFLLGLAVAFVLTSAVWAASR